MNSILRLLLFVISLAISVAGCSQSNGSAGKDVQGSVTWKSAPLEQGVIFFVPASKSGNGASLEILQGRFDSTRQASKLLPGKYRVEITSSQKTGKMIPGPGPNGQVEEFVQVIPAIYNEQSKLSADVSDSEPNHFQFDLTSKNR